MNELKSLQHSTTWRAGRSFNGCFPSTKATALIIILHILIVSITVITREQPFIQLMNSSVQLCRTLIDVYHCWCMCVYVEAIQEVNYR